MTKGMTSAPFPDAHERRHSLRMAATLASSKKASRRHVPHTSQPSPGLHSAHLQQLVSLREANRACVVTSPRFTKDQLPTTHPRRYQAPTTHQTVEFPLFKINCAVQHNSTPIERTPASRSTPCMPIQSPTNLETKDRLAHQLPTALLGRRHVLPSKTAAAFSTPSCSSSTTTLARYRRLIGMFARKLAAQVVAVAVSIVAMKRHHAARVVQRACRRHVLHHRHTCAALVVQRLWRGHIGRLAAQRLVRQVAIKFRAAFQIGRAGRLWRRRLACRAWRREAMEAQARACRVIQGSYRRHRNRRLETQRQQRRRFAVCAVQAWWRRRRRLQVAAAMQIQAWARRRSRQRRNSAWGRIWTLLQATWRMHVARTRFGALKLHTIQLQRRHRRRSNLRAAPSTTPPKRDESRPIIAEIAAQRIHHGNNTTPFETDHVLPIQTNQGSPRGWEVEISAGTSSATSVSVDDALLSQPHEGRLNHTHTTAIGRRPSAVLQEDPVLARHPNASSCAAHDSSRQAQVATGMSPLDTSPPSASSCWTSHEDKLAQPLAWVLSVPTTESARPTPTRFLPSRPTVAVPSVTCDIDSPIPSNDADESLYHRRVLWCFVQNWWRPRHRRRHRSCMTLQAWFRCCWARQVVRHRRAQAIETLRAWMKTHGPPPAVDRNDAIPVHAHVDPGIFPIHRSVPVGCQVKPSVFVWTWDPSNDRWTT
ncbi:hypothetical protein H310_01626 [Aphanomyces invadans]|uniref:Uncharacterized protein n=1 Tax=Aphanomyces invadans TaxID=157072 RepID=A0A024UTE6_9STRA|nr:hypothetical protein H310_01626 [Aphanomyces invadans]ETW09202.1 hypothetical protein H310_01626 [Aphanomyces invadans]|eukprot:XP_008863007.1 hypothetical protein H310_01626 [Aphanomyces invadans]